MKETKPYGKRSDYILLLEKFIETIKDKEFLWNDILYDLATTREERGLIQGIIAQLIREKYLIVTEVKKGTGKRQFYIQKKITLPILLKTK